MVSWWNLFQAIIVVVAFGGIVGRVLECSNGINVRPAKQGYEIVVEVEKDRGLLGNFLRERNQSQIKDHLVQENILKIEKVIQA